MFDIRNILKNVFICLIVCLEALQVSTKEILYVLAVDCIKASASVLLIVAMAWFITLQFLTFLKKVIIFYCKYI